MLVCPGCAGRLGRQTTEKGVIYACPNCRGRAVSLSVLRRAASHDFLRDLWAKTISGRYKGGRRCPHCQGVMNPAVFPDGESNYVLDVCRSCQIVWFDPGEYQTLPVEAGAAAAAEEPLGEELSEQGVEALARTKLAALAAREQASESKYPEHGWQWLPAILGLPVEFNSPRLVRSPILTWGLTLTMVAIYAVMMLSGAEADVISQWGFIPAQWERHDGLTLITSFFLHAGIWHLVANMYFFMIFADNVEDHLGRWPFLLLLLGSHLVGALVHSMYDPRTDIALVGASAGISGVIAYYAIVFPRAKVGMFLRFGLIPIYWFRISVVTALVLYVLVQLLGAWMQINGFTNVSALGHLGGLAVGVAAGIAARIYRSDPTMRPDRYKAG